jgi:hypothetical protein
MVLKQNNCCEICNKPESALGMKKDGNPKRLSVDHHHLSKKVRGLLCQRCNSGLGQFFEDIKTLENAISYIKKYHNKT